MMCNKNDNIKLIERLHHIWNTGNLDLIPEVYSENIIVHWPKGWGEKSVGHKGVIDSIKVTRNIFLEWNEEVLDIICDGEKVVTRYKSTGIHSKKCLGAEASNKKIEFEEISIYHIEHGKVIEQWCLGDDLFFLHQIKKN